MLSKLSGLLKVLICFILVAQIMGCGTILYPDRRGQRSGKIDAGVAVMDGLGLLLFVIPGIIAFVVDFSTGTIYLPGTTRSSLDVKDIKIVRFDPNHTTYEKLEKIIKNETGFEVKLNLDKVKVIRLKDVDDAKLSFAKAYTEYNN